MLPPHPHPLPHPHPHPHTAQSRLPLRCCRPQLLPPHAVQCRPAHPLATRRACHTAIVPKRTIAKVMQALAHRHMDHGVGPSQRWRRRSRSCAARARFSSPAVPLPAATRSRGSPGSRRSRAHLPPLTAEAPGHRVSGRHPNPGKTLHQTLHDADRTCASSCTRSPRVLVPRARPRAGGAAGVARGP